MKILSLRWRPVLCTVPCIVPCVDFLQLITNARTVLSAALCSIIMCSSITHAENRAPEVSSSAKQVLRIGHFPNVTHAQALILRNQGRSDTLRTALEERLGAKIEWYTYNAGPSAMEALLAGALDLTYVGPNPALNLYLKSRGSALRVISGSARGGSGLVVQKELFPGPKALFSPDIFRGKSIGTPQFGNTQDVAARAWFRALGLTVTPTGGDLRIIPTEGPDQLTLFSRKSLDGVWAVEPWLSRLILEADGKLAVEEPEALTTVLVASTKALLGQRELIKRFLEEHLRVSAELAAAPPRFAEVVRAEISELTKKELPQTVIDAAFSRLQFTTKISSAEFSEFAERARELQLLKSAPVPLEKIVETPT